MGIGTTTADMRGMGSRQGHSSHDSWHGQPGGPGMRTEPVAAALAAALAASLVTRRTSDQILQGRCISARMGLDSEVRGACNEPR